MAFKDTLKEGIYRFLHGISRSSDPVRVILLYHTVGGGLEQSISEEAFTEQMRFLSNNFRVLPLKDFADTIGDRSGDDTACVTFDDGHLDNWSCARPIMNQFDVRGTFFITTGSIGGELKTWSGSARMMNEDHLRALVRDGHELGAHTVNHVELPQVAPEVARQEVAESRRHLEDLIERPVTSFAYPKGRLNDEVRGLVKDEGFTQAVTTEESLVGPGDDPLTLPRVWIGPEMSLTLVQYRLSPALESYRTLRGFVPVL